MRQPHLFKIACVLDEHESVKVKREIDDVFHPPTDVQFITGQRGEELVLLRMAHSVHTLGEVVQRVKAYLAFLKDRQLCRFDLRDRSGGAEVFGIHSQLIEPCRELCFRTRERHLRAVRCSLNCCFDHFSPP